MPRLIAAMKGTLAAIDCDSWEVMTLASSTDLVDTASVQPRTQLTNLTFHLRDLDSSNRFFYWGLSEDLAGNYPLTGMHTQSLSAVKEEASSAWGGFSATLNLDFLATSNSTAGVIYCWCKINGSVVTPTINATLAFSES